MKAEGLTGAVRGKVKKTTIPDPAAERARDLVGRNFAPAAPERLWVADVTYVSTWSGWVYVAFVTDAYARRVLGWRCGTSMTTSTQPPSESTSSTIADYISTTATSHPSKPRTSTTLETKPSNS